MYTTKFLQVDQSISRKFAEEFKGKEYDVSCDSCQGTGHHLTPYFKVKKKWKCKQCEGKGTYKMTC